MQTLSPEAPAGWTYQPRQAPPDWREAACDGHPDPDRVLFPDPGPGKDVGDRSRWDEGRALCSGCPVRTDCLDYALTVNEQYGMWGGLTPDERGALRRKLDLRAPRRHLDAVPTLDGVPSDGRQHGTPWAYNYHRRIGEDACGPCRKAKREYWRQQDAAGERGRRLPRSESIRDRWAG